MASVRDIISQTAARHGVDPATALAVAWQESRWNPTAVGDGGTSFGLYQLHEGGMLGDNTKEWAFNPWNNADRAISSLADVAADHPTWSPGEIAVASQRPAEEVRPEYVSNVNGWVPQIRAGQFPPVGEGAEVPGSGPVPGEEAGFQQASPAAALRLLGPAARFVGQLFSRLARAGQHAGRTAGRTARRTPVDDAALAMGRLIGVLALPNIGIRLFAGVLGLIFLIGGIFVFAGK